MGMFKGSAGGDTSSEDVEERFAQLEKRIMLLERALRNYGIPIPIAYEGEPTEVSPAVRQLVLDGNKIKAIKLLVEETGLGLKQAKDIIDRL